MLTCRNSLYTKGGFFSGFRYLIRNLIRHVMEEDFDIEYPFRVFKTKEEVTRHVVARVQIADDLIILQDGRVLRDAVLTFQDEDGSTFYRYYEGVTFAFHDDLNIREEEVIYIYMAWGNGKTSGHVFDGVIRYADTGTLINMFLHPVIQVGDLSRDIHEVRSLLFTDADLSSPLLSIYTSRILRWLGGIQPTSYQSKPLLRKLSRVGWTSSPTNTRPA